MVHCSEFSKYDVNPGPPVHKHRERPSESSRRHLLQLFFSALQRVDMSSMKQAAVSIRDNKNIHREADKTKH